MSKKVLLIDWDDVVMDRGKVKELQSQKAAELLGETRANSLWQSYEEWKDAHEGRADVDAFINSFTDSTEQARIRECFYGIAFHECVDKNGWQVLKDTAFNQGIDLRLFTEGSVKYQYFKISASGLDVPDEMIGVEGVADIYQDKIGKFEETYRALRDQGYEVIGYADDRISYLNAVDAKTEGKVKCFWVTGNETPAPEWFAGKVANLTELAHSLGQVYSKVEFEAPTAERLG